MFRPKKKKRLIISCPTWHLEEKIQEQTPEECFFMNILGGIYIDDELFMDQLIQTINLNKINKLNVVANPNCSFLKNIIQPQSNLETQAEEVMTKIYHKKYDTLQSIADLQERRMALAYYCAQFSLGRILQDHQFQENFKQTRLKTGIITYGETINI